MIALWQRFHLIVFPFEAEDITLGLNAVDATEVGGVSR